MYRPNQAASVNDRTDWQQYPAPKNTRMVARAARNASFLNGPIQSAMRGD